MESAGTKDIKRFNCNLLAQNGNMQLPQPASLQPPHQRDPWQAGNVPARKAKHCAWLAVMFSFAGSDSTSAPSAQTKTMLKL